MYICQVDYSVTALHTLLLILSFAAVLVIVVSPFYIVRMYNTLANLKNEREATWDSIQVEMKRRTELLPDLMQIRNQFLDHEKTTFETVVKARQQVNQAREQFDRAHETSEKQIAYETLAGAWSRLLVVVEAHPQLTSQPIIRKLFDEVANSINRVTAAELELNKTTKRYNTLLDNIPNNVLFVRLFGFERLPYLYSRTR